MDKKKIEKILGVLDFVFLGLMVAGIIWAAVSYIVATWDMAPVYVTVGVKVSALWKPITLIIISVMYLNARK